MSRIVRQIEVEGRSLNAMFDTGAVRSYVTREAFPNTGLIRRTIPVTVGLGGRERRLEERCDFAATVEGLDFDITAYVIDDSVETEFGRIDVIVGALTMEEWWIKLDPANNEMDLSMLRRREFTELTEW
jgi:hypothetical protein